MKLNAVFIGMICVALALMVATVAAEEPRLAETTFVVS